MICTEFRKFKRIGNGANALMEENRRDIKRGEANTKLSLCLTPTCRGDVGRHFIQIHSHSSDALKIRLNEQFQTNNKTRITQLGIWAASTITNVCSAPANNNQSKCAFLEVSFLERKRTADLIEEQGADTKIDIIERFKANISKRT